MEMKTQKKKDDRGLNRHPLASANGMARIWGTNTAELRLISRSFGLETLRLLVLPAVTHDFQSGRVAMEGGGDTELLDRVGRMSNIEKLFTFVMFVTAFREWKSAILVLRLQVL